MEKLLSIIIPIDDWRSDDEKDLQAGVECLLNQNIPKEELELVFVVGQNDSKISDILQSYSNTYLNMVRVTDSDASSMVNTVSGKYALFYDFSNRWEEGALGEACRYMNQCAVPPSFFMCREIFQKKTSAKSTFRFLYKNGNHIVNVKEKPRSISVSLNNVIFLTEALKEGIKELSNGKKLQYGRELYLLSRMLMNNPNVGIISSAGFIYRNSERLSSQQSNAGMEYVRNLNILFRQLELLVSDEASQYYIWNVMLYVMKQYMEGADTPQTFTDEEQNAYLSLLREKLHRIPDDIIDSAPGTVQIQRMGLYAAKYGHDIFRNSTAEKSAVTWKGHRLVNLKHDAFRIYTLNVQGEMLCITGTIDAGTLNQEMKLTARDEIGKEWSAELHPYSKGDIKNRFDEVLLAGRWFRLSVPLHMAQTINFYLDINNSKIKIYPKLMGDTGLKHQYRYSYVEIAGWLIRYDSGALIAIPKTVLRLFKLHHNYLKELHRKKDAAGEADYRKKLRWSKKIRKLKLKNQIAFVSARSNDGLLPNIRNVYNRTTAEKVVFVHMMPYTDEQMERAIEAVYSSKVVVTDDYFYLFRKFGKKPGQKFVQLWHATGAFKKFGLDGTDLFPEVDRLYHKDYDLASVSGENLREIYASAFGIEREKVKAYGAPRTDEILQSQYTDERKKEILDKYPNLKEKQVILYAPTFRDSNGKDKHIFHPVMDFESLSHSLKRNQVFIICPHPVMQNRIPDREYHNIIQVDDFTTNEMMCIADLLVTDYSSVIFEYSLLNKPMVFYCYDYDEYNRDFYLDYEKDLPGKMFRKYGDLEQYICNGEFKDVATVQEFRNRYMSACDGKSGERLAHAVEKLLEE